MNENTEMIRRIMDWALNQEGRHNPDAAFALATLMLDFVRDYPETCDPSADPRHWRTLPEIRVLAERRAS